MVFPDLLRPQVVGAVGNVTVAPGRRPSDEVLRAASGYRRQAETDPGAADGTGVDGGTRPRRRRRPDRRDRNRERVPGRDAGSRALGAHRRQVVLLLGDRSGLPIDRRSRRSRGVPTGAVNPVTDTDTGKGREAGQGGRSRAPAVARSVCVREPSGDALGGDRGREVGSVRGDGLEVALERLARAPRRRRRCPGGGPCRR